MKIRYIGPYAGACPEVGNAKPGDVIEVDDKLGRRLLTSGQFVEEVPMEKAATATAEVEKVRKGGEK